MNRTQLMTELLDVLNDSEVDGSWSPERLWGYLAEGQDKFCEDTGYFKDASTHTLTLQQDVALYDMPARIIQIIDIWDGTRKLIKVPTGDRFYGEGVVGTPSMWETDFETGVIKLYPTPTSAEDGNTLTLQVWRYSLQDLADTSASPAINPEIPVRFQRAIICWAAYKAFSQHDMEEQDPVKAQDHLRMYQAYARDGKVALKRYQNQEVRIGTDPAYRT